jgi:hypothetical protein
MATFGAGPIRARLLAGVNSGLAGKVPGVGCPDPDEVRPPEEAPYAFTFVFSMTWRSVAYREMGTGGSEIDLVHVVGTELEFSRP